MTPQERTIGGVTYEVIPLNATDSIAVMARILGLAGTALRSVRALKDARAAVGAFLATSLDTIETDDFLFLAKTLAKVTKVVDGKTKRPLDTIFDEHFRGRFWDLPEWVKFAAEVTYGPLEEIPARLTPPGTPKEAPKEAPEPEG